jgi:glycerophosphoryl diester phosphodiesterase
VRRTRDDQFVLFHDFALDCRTNGTGPVAKHPASELQTLDVGYGYTADGGRTFPLRGKGVGLMPTLADALSAHPNAHFLLQIKDANPRIGDLMVRYLEERNLSQWDRLVFFGVPAPLIRLKALRPQARIWATGSAGRCGMRYIEFGWTGHFPDACNNGMMFVPISQAWLFWGWPDRFLSRMHGHGTEVMLIGRMNSLSAGNFTRLDTLEELAKVPPGFSGAIWTDRVDVIGPAHEKQ